MIQSLLNYGQTFLVDFVRLIMWLALLSVVFVPLERLFALHPAKVFRKDVGADLFYYFANSIIPALLLSVPLGLVAALAHAAVPPVVHATVASAPFWARTLGALVVAETGYYWGHRAMHTIPLLWRFHSVHHSAVHIDFLVNTRAHPLDMVFGRMCGTIPLIVIGLAGVKAGADATMPLLVIFLGTFWGFFIHANLRWRLGPLEWLVTSPAFHHWHHTLEAPGALASRNYASTLPWLDRLFGTHYLPKSAWPARYGINETMPNSLRDQLANPLLEPRPWPVA